MTLNYSYCVENPFQILLLAIDSHFYLYIYGCNAYDAFTHIPGPYAPIFISIYDQFSDWYRHRFGRNINTEKFIPVLIYLQGHLESVRLWESLIKQILKRMGFTNTTHDRTIYIAVYKLTGENIYIIIQLYNFELSCSNEYSAKDIYDKIGDALQLPGKSDKTLPALVLLRI